SSPTRRSSDLILAPGTPGWPNRRLIRPRARTSERPAGGTLSNAAESPSRERDMDQEEQRRRPWRAKLQRLVQRVRRFRERIRHRRGLNTTYRVALGTFGTLVLLAGPVMIPYPGPGWLVVRSEERSVGQCW